MAKLAEKSLVDGMFAAASKRLAHSSRQVIVSLTFDDTNDNQFLARSILAEHRVPATFYVNSNRIGRPGFMSLAEVQSLAADGNEIGSHTLDHVPLPGRPVDEQRRQIGEDRERLIALGFDVQSFAYPWGKNDATTREIVKECGYTSGRGAGTLDFPHWFFGTHSETSPPKDPFAIRASHSIRKTQGVGYLQFLVRMAQRSGGWIPVLFHHLGCSGKVLETQPDIFADFVRWLADERQAGRVDLATMADVMRRNK